MFSRIIKQFECLRLAVVPKQLDMDDEDARENAWMLFLGFTLAFLAFFGCCWIAWNNYIEYGEFSSLEWIVHGFALLLA